MPSSPSTLVRIGGRAGEDVHVHAVPETTGAEARAQLRSALAAALGALRDAGLAPSDVAAGRVFFATRPSWPWRHDLATVAGGPLPFTGLVQPPATGGRACEILLHARAGSRPADGPTPPGEPAVSVRTGRDGRHVWLSGVRPGPDRRPDDPPASLAADMFARAAAALSGAGASFADVVRTWIWVRDIHRRYAALNQARTAFFAGQRLCRLPASTGIEGALVDDGGPFAMDAYAFVPAAGATVRTMRAHPMGEASDYGSSFSRGTLVATPHRRTAWVSGTASVDERGQVVAVGDAAGQIVRTLANLAGLLAGADLALADAVSATLYVAQAADGPAFLASARLAGLPRGTPTAVVVAPVCRPEWLCELELCAARAADHPVE